MTLDQEVVDGFQFTGNQLKALRTLINGNAADLSALSTTAKGNLVLAINEIQAAVGAGSPTTLNDLTDVDTTGDATGYMLRRDGSDVYVAVNPLTYLEAAGAAAAAQAAAIAASQPVDPDLTAIAALTTTSYGRAFLALADQAALMGLIPAASDTVVGKTRYATLAEMTTGTSAVLAATPEGVRQERIALKAEILGAGVPGALDTLDELAAALGDDANFASTITTALANRLRVDAAQGLTAPQQQFGRDNLNVWSKAEIGSVTTDYVAVIQAALV
jgi:hypothetical protein